MNWRETDLVMLSTTAVWGGWGLGGERESLKKVQDEMCI